MEEIDYKNLPTNHYGSPLPPALKEELLAEIAERKRVIDLGYTDEQFEAHMQLWKKEWQTTDLSVGSAPSPNPSQEGNLSKPDQDVRNQ